MHRSSSRQRSLRLLFLTEYYPPATHGGGERSCQLLAKHLADAGAQITVLTSAVPGIPRMQREHRVTVIRALRTGGNPASPLANIRRVLTFRRSLLRQTAKLHTEQQFDAVHCFNMTALPAVELRTIMGIPFLAHVNSLTFACPKGDLLYHGKSLCRIRCTYRTFVPCLRDCSEIGKMRNSPLISHNPLALSTIYARYFNQQRLLRAFDHVVAISTFLQERLIHIGIPRTRISVLHNIIETPPHSRSRSSSSIPRLLYIGTLSAAKGIPVLLDTLRNLPGTWHCDIYGSGPCTPAVRAAASCDKRIALHAPVPERRLHALFQRASIVLFPSHWPEPLGRVPIEAMVAGRPVIASRTGGIIDVVTSQTGVLIPPGYSPALRNAITKLLRNSALRRRLGAAGQRRIRTHFAPKALTARMLQIYRKVLR